MGYWGTSGKQYYNDIWQSNDGVTWKQVAQNAEFSPRFAQNSVVFDDKIWVIGGRDGSTFEPLNDVWYSSDGISWNRATSKTPFVPRWDFGCTVFNNKIWVIGGSRDGKVLNDVWSSQDGVNWEEATDSAPFSPRMNIAATTFKDKIWITGGFNWQKDFNDVWCSDNGKTWILVTPNAGFAERRYHDFLTDGTNLLVVGGIQDNKDMIYYRDIWKSLDGKNWERLEPEGKYPRRYGQSSVLFNKKIWILGGTGGANEIWYFSQDPSFFPLGKMESEETIPSISQQDGVSIQKNVSPTSVKEGKPVSITVILANKGKDALHDIEIVDPVIPGFILLKGTNQGSFTLLKTQEQLNLTYTVIPEKAGSYQLGRASVLYADNEGEYHLAKSNDPQIQVIAPILIETPRHTSNGLENNKILSDIGKILTGIFY